MYADKHCESSLTSFITCGNMLGSGEKRGVNQYDVDLQFERAILNNEYLQVLKDKEFMQRPNVNFL
jgi:hypothetical protein